jgi:hypothetical protein
MDKRAQIEDAGRRGVCPNCGKPLGSGRVGTGSLVDGVFCSLGCLTKFDFDEGGERVDGDS